MIPKIEFVETAEKTTLLIDGEQAMQGWEDALMRRGGDIFCSHGSEFLEIGLGLGLSAMHIADKPTARHHVVFELHQPVIDRFRAQTPDPPAALAIRLGDFFELLPGSEPASVDGIFFDPYLPPAKRNDPGFWSAVVPPMAALLRPGGVFVPCFNTRPYFLAFLRPRDDRAPGLHDLPRHDVHGRRLRQRVHPVLLRAG